MGRFLPAVLYLQTSAAAGKSLTPQRRRADNAWVKHRGQPPGCPAGERQIHVDKSEPYRVGLCATQGLRTKGRGLPQHSLTTSPRGGVLSCAMGAGRVPHGSVAIPRSSTESKARGKGRVV